MQPLLRSDQEQGTQDRSHWILSISMAGDPTTSPSNPRQRSTTLSVAHFFLRFSFLHFNFHPILGQHCRGAGSICFPPMPDGWGQFFWVHHMTKIVLSHPISRLTHPQQHRVRCPMAMPDFSWQKGTFGKAKVTLGVNTASCPLSAATTTRMLPLEPRWHGMRSRTCGAPHTT